jgi:hypothetical protein
MSRGILTVLRFHLLTPESVLSLALISHVLAAESIQPSCDDVQRRVHGRPPASLRLAWHELGITPSDLLFDWQNRTNQYPEKARLQVDRESGPLPAMRSEYVLLVISQAPYGPYQYLFFTRMAGACRYIGHVDTWDKHERPKHRVVPRVSGGIWFILDTVGYGSGFRREVEQWYAVNTKIVRSVLDYPRLGYESVGIANS